VANQEHLAILRKGREAWNAWRQGTTTTPDLSGANFSNGSLMGVELANANLAGADLIKTALWGVNLSGANLSGANLNNAALIDANLTGANLSNACLHEAALNGATLIDANLRKAVLFKAILIRANLRSADLSEAILSSAQLFNANLRNANLSKANLSGAMLVDTDLRHACLMDCEVFAISVWRVNLDGAIQRNLVITEPNEVTITVDNLEVAQFIYLLLNNQKLRDVIDAITSKVVLILGRFSPDRKTVLDAIRKELRKLDYLPILFDFNKPTNVDVTGTVEMLARMSRFIIADLTEPSSIPHELATIVPFLRTIPVLPIKLAGTVGYTMFADYQRAYPWVLKTCDYTDAQSFISALPKTINTVDKLSASLRNPRPNWWQLLRSR
jgi:hypothetical protein